MRLRSIRHRKRRSGQEVADLDITSLLDVLTILLVFLLMNYNSGMVINIPDGIVIPKSASQDPNSAGVIIQMSADKLWVDDKEIMNLKDKQNNLKFYDEGGRRIVPLFNELVRKREDIEALKKSIKREDEKFSGIANLVVDKKIKYTDVKRLLFTCAEAGFLKYKFVVLTKGE